MKKKKSLVGWIVRDIDLEYHRSSMGSDMVTFVILRGNPNPSNYTDKLYRNK